jgi:outer membrane protein
MKHYAKLLTLICAAWLFTQAAFAADLSEIFQLAVENDPEIASAEAGYLATREIVDQARSALLPQLGVGASTSDNRLRVPVSGSSDLVSNFNSHGYQITLSQPVLRMESWYQFKQSKNIEAGALALFASQQQDLINRVAQSYFNILEAQDLLEATSAERDAVQRQLEQVQQRFDVGLVAITDVLESTAAYDTSTVNVIEAEGAQRISFETLLRLTGQPISDVATLSEQFPVEYPEPRSEDAWVNAALEHNYLLQADREAVKSAEQQLKASKSDHYPTIDSSVTYTDSTSGGGIFVASKQDQRAATLTLNVPIYSGGYTSSKVREATHRLAEATRRFDLTQRTVVENTRSLYTAINTDVGRVRARLKGIESSQSALEATETGYEVGTRNIVDVLLVQQRLYEAQFRYASARYKYITDTLLLKQLAGSLSPQDIHDLNRFLMSSSPVSRTKLITK